MVLPLYSSFIFGPSKKLCLSSSQSSSSSSSSSCQSNIDRSKVISESKLILIQKETSATNPRLQEWADKQERQRQLQVQVQLQYHSDQERFQYPSSSSRTKRRFESSVLETCSTDDNLRLPYHQSNSNSIKRQKTAVVNGDDGVGRLSFLTAKGRGGGGGRHCSSAYHFHHHRRRIGNVISPPNHSPFGELTLKHDQKNHSSYRCRRNEMDHYDYYDQNAHHGREFRPSMTPYPTSSVPFPVNVASSPSMMTMIPRKTTMTAVAENDDPGRLYHEFRPPQDCDNGRYWKERCMYMQDICRDTRRQVRELQEDQRQLRARVHELEEQLLSGPIQQQQTHHEHHHNDHDIVNTGDDEQDMDKQKNSGSYPRETTENRINGSAAIAAPAAPYPSPPMAASHTKRVSIDAAHPDTVDVDDADRNEPSLSPPTVIVTSAQQHRIVSSCLYMTDGEGLSDEDNDID